MANKNISNLPFDSNPVTGDFLMTWDVSSQTTRKIYINKLITLTPEQTSTFPTTGIITGGLNVGPGEGSFFNQSKNGLLEFKTLKAGSNISITNNTGDVTVNAADPPAVPLQSIQNIGNGVNLISGVQGTTINVRTIVAGTGISFRTGQQTVTIDCSVSGAALTNVGVGEGRVLSGYQGPSGILRTLKAGTGIALQTGAQEITINFSGLPYQICIGSGQSFTAPYAGDGTTTAAFPSGVSFTGAGGKNMGSPILNFPAGTATYMIDFMWGWQKGSISTDFWLRFRNNTNGTWLWDNDPALHFTPGNGGPQTSLPYTWRRIERITGPITVQPFISFSGGSEDSNGVYPCVMSSGTSFSYLRIG